MGKLIQEKLLLETKDDFEKVKTLLGPIEDFIDEKIKNNMYDDWNEFEHTKKNLKELEENILNKSGDMVYVYYLKDEDKIVGFCFVLAGNNKMRQFLEDNNFAIEEKVCQLHAFHIIKEYRGVGPEWLVNYIFPDLIEKEIHTVYFASSHNRAFPFYDRLGERVGTYIGSSDHKLYQRFGYIFKIKI